MISEKITEEILNKHQKGETLQNLVKEYKPIKVKEIIKIIANYYINKGEIKQRMTSVYRSNRPEPKKIDVLFQEYKNDQENFKFKDVSLLYGIHPDIMVEIIRQMFERERKEKFKIRQEKPIKDNESKIIKLFELGKSFNSISEIFKTSLDEIEELIKKYYIKKGQEFPKRNILPIEELIRYLKQGWNINSLRKKFLIEDNIIITEQQEQTAKEILFPSKYKKIDDNII